MIECKLCDLCISSKRIVQGKGNYNADIMLIGEAPGYYEEKHGEPFCGRAGQHLTKYLKLANFPRYMIYMTNVVKCRPPNNRTPSQQEMYACSREYLAKEITTIKPKIVLLMGNTALRTITCDPFRTVTGTKGWFTFNRYTWFYATYHPSASLRNKQWRPRMVKDFIEVAEIYRKINPYHIINYDVKEEIL